MHRYMYSAQQILETLHFSTRYIPEFRIILTKSTEYCFKEYQLVVFLMLTDCVLREKESAVL